VSSALSFGAFAPLEGAIWREFGWSELAWPLMVLVLIGAVGLGLGTAMISSRHHAE
jgi:hypothetical protein